MAGCLQFSSLRERSLSLQCYSFGDEEGATCSEYRLALMKLSIIIPVYNEPRTIVVLIERLKQSGCADFEWIFVDDGSTDGTLELLRAQRPFVEPWK